LKAWGRAGKAAASDEEAISFAISSLDDPASETSTRVLTEWPGDQVVEELQSHLADERWFVRHRALEVLEARGLKDKRWREALAILDTAKGEDCDRRKVGLAALAVHGATTAAFDAVQSLHRERVKSPCISDEDFNEAERSISGRLAATK
jgi:hypothetical protein